MRKLFSVLSAAAFTLSLVAAGCANGSAPPPPEPVKKEAEGTGKKAAPKIGVKLFTGTIEAFDAATGTLTLKGPKGVMDFKVDGRAKKDLDDMNIGDKVIVKHTGEMVRSIVKPGANINAHSSKEKEGAVKVEGSVPQAE